MVELGCRPDDVGHLLVQVEDDLLQLKTRLLASKQSHKPGSHVELDLTYLENAIARTEQSIKLKKEQALNRINEEVRTVFDMKDDKSSTMPPSSMATMETLWDMKLGCKTTVQTLNARNSLQLLKRQETKLVAPDGLQTMGFTPAQASQHSLNVRIMNNPHNARNREVVNTAYNVQLPEISRHKTHKTTVEVVKGSTVLPLAILPKVGRLP
jgi:hypothetical protein